MKKTVTLELTQIDQGIEALLSNAEDLVSEAKTLFSVNAFARAFTLAHLAREELSKVGMLQAAALRLLAEHPVDWKKLMYRLRDHKAKLYQEHFENSLFSQGSNAGLFNPMLPQVADQVVDYRNNQKNDSLYVSIEEGKFIKPADRFNVKKAERTIKLAEIRLNEQRFNQADLGPYAERQIGSLRGRPNIDQQSLEELYACVSEVTKSFSSYSSTTKRSKG